MKVSNYDNNTGLPLVHLWNMVGEEVWRSARLLSYELYVVITTKVVDEVEGTSCWDTTVAWDKWKQVLKFKGRFIFFPPQNVFTLIDDIRLISNNI